MSVRAHPLLDPLRPWVHVWRRLRSGEITVAHAAYARAFSFSQFGEDVFLDRYFGEQESGFYVDVGAFDPFVVSNTFLLYRRGWCGINLEPVPAALARLRRYRPRDVNLPFAVASSAGRREFVVSGSFSGLDTPAHLWPTTRKHRIEVEVHPLAAVLEEYVPSGREIDLLCVDCEGHDLEVLRSSAWDRFRPRLVLAEEHPAAGTSSPLSAYLEQQRYRLLTRLGLTLVFERAD